MDNKTDIQTESKLKFHVFQDERFVDLNLYQFGWERCEPLHQFGPAKRNHFLFHYVLSGQGTLDTNNTVYSIRPGQGFLLCPNQISTYYADRDDPWVYTWLEFDGLRARESVTMAGLSEKNPVYTPISRGAGEALARQMMHIVNNSSDSPIRLVGHGMIFLDELIRSSRAKAATGSKRLRDFYIKEAISFIEGNYRRDVAIEELAAACGLNRSYFGRLFKETMGVSPQQFLIQYRMTKAGELLKGSTLSVAEVGKAVGYENQLHFSRAFKSVFQLSPSAYRKRHYIQRDDE